MGGRGLSSLRTIPLRLNYKGAREVDLYGHGVHLTMKLGARVFFIFLEYLLLAIVL